MTVPPPPPPRRASSLATLVLALAVAASGGWIGWRLEKLEDRLRLNAELSATHDARPPANDDGLAKLQDRLRLDAELARTTAAVSAFDNVVETRRSEMEHGLACLSFLDLLSQKPGFDGFAADPERTLAKTIYSKAVYEIEGVTYATKDAEHPMTKELKNCLAPGAGQERIGFPDEFSVIAFRDRFDAQADAVFTPRFHLLLHTLALALIEYRDLTPPARKLIEGEVGDWICKTAVRRLFLRKAESAVVRSKIAQGPFAGIDGYIGADCPG